MGDEEYMMALEVELVGIRHEMAEARSAAQEIATKQEKVVKNQREKGIEIAKRAEMRAGVQVRMKKIAEKRPK